MLRLPRGLLLPTLEKSKKLKKRHYFRLLVFRVEKLREELRERDSDLARDTQRENSRETTNR